MASTAHVWSQLFSWISLLLTVILLTPQAYLNYQNQSTEGLSTAMMYAFLTASIIPAAYYVYQSEPVALTLSWFGFALVGIFVLCQVPYYSPTSPADKTAAESEQRRLIERRKQFAYHFTAYVLVSSWWCAFFYFLFVLSGPSSAFSWLPSTLGYIIPTALTIVGYLLQLRLIVATKDASGISPGFMALDLSACACSVVSIAFDEWDGAAVAPFFVIIACQLTMAFVRFCVYPPNKQYKVEQLDEQTDTGGEGDEYGEEEERDEFGEEDEEEGEGEADEQTMEDAEESMESGLDEQSGAGQYGHVQPNTVLDSTSEDERYRGEDVELASVSRVDQSGDR